MSEQPPKNDPTTANQKFVPIRLGTLRGASVASFDIYVPVSDHHVHYIKISDTIDLDRLSKLKAKGIKKLFIPRDQEETYLKYLDEGLGQLSNSTVPIEKRSESANAALVTLSEGASRAVETEAGYKSTQVQIGKVMDFLEAEKGAARSIMSAVGISEDIHQHCASVATLSLAMAQSFGVKDINHLLELGMAAMLHDVGLSLLKFDLETPKVDLTAEQIREYEGHPEAARALLGGKRHVSPNVLQLILDHEELGGGTGYPAQKDLNKLNLMSQILNVCNNYDRYCKHKSTSLSRGIDAFIFERTGFCDKRLLNGLAKVIKG
jgi:HD-GYP domain-containing protein (c-di-GMP phosphodiesterase class II)